MQGCTLSLTLPFLADSWEFPRMDEVPEMCGTVACIVLSILAIFIVLGCDIAKASMAAVCCDLPAKYLSMYCGMHVLEP